MSIQLKDGLANQPVDHVLEDLLVRFVINCPDEDLSSIERVFFQVEEAQWFYTDFIRQLNPSLPSMKMKGFAPKLLSKCPLLWKWGDPADALAQFGNYKRTIPVRGIALLNKDMTKMILVQGTESSLWSFPRGKISKGEDDLVCAVREVKEETGFDATNYVNEKDVVERTVYGKNFKIYVARNVPEDYKFEPEVRNEIALIQWHDIKGLQKMVKQSPNKFFIVGPFLKPLTRYINRNKGVVTEEELMRDAEQKLKQLMGITPTPTASVDAGRELLNILQGAAEPHAPAAVSNANGSPVAVPQPQQYIQMNVPQHLQSFYAGMGLMPQFFPPAHPNGFMPVQPLLRPPQFNGGFFANQGPVQYPHAPQQHIQRSPVQQVVQSPVTQGPHAPVAQAPDAQSLSTSSANSKELLSILKGGPLKNGSLQAQPHVKPEPATRAGEFLQMLNRKPESPATGSETPKKVNILKREKGALESDASATLLGLLGKKPPAEEQPKHEVATPGPQKSLNASAELLGLINAKPKKAQEPTQEHQAPNGHTKPEKRDAAAELLGLINRKPVKELPSQQVNELNPISPPSDSSVVSNGQSTNNENKKASNELLDLLNQPKKPLRIAKRDSQSPADLKSVLGGPVSAPTQEVSNATLILSTLNRKSATPQSAHYTPQPTPQPEDFEEFEDFEDFEDFDEVSSSQHDIYNSIANTYNVDSEEEEYEEAVQSIPTEKPAPQEANGHEAGKHLLLLLNGGKPHSPGSYQETYGSSVTSPAPQVSTPTPNVSASNGADILRILGRRPTVEANANSGSRNELLSLLKGNHS